MKETMKKIAQISTDLGNFEQWHFQKKFCFIFFMDELHWALILFVIFKYTAHVASLETGYFPFRLKHGWLFNYTLLSV